VRKAWEWLLYRIAWGLDAVALELQWRAEQQTQRRLMTPEAWRKRQALEQEMLRRTREAMKNRA